MGRRAVRALGGLAVAAALCLVSATPAAAKGPTGVAIGTAGEPKLSVDGLEGGNDEVFYRLAADLGIWGNWEDGGDLFTGGGTDLLSAAPTDHLGPALEVDWAMYNAIPSNPDDEPHVLQTVYPFAVGGPLVHTAAGQRVFGSDVTAGGWYRAPDRLLVDLADLGITAEVLVPVPEGAAADRAAARLAPAPGAGGWSSLAVTAAAVALVAALVAGALARTGRRAPVPGG
jgi:hypothetical protein